METLQNSSKELISYADVKRPTKHGKHREGYFASEKWREYNRQKQAKYRSKKRTLKPVSLFQKNKQKQLLKLLVNNCSFVPVPFGLKHPIIKNWNANNYFYNQKIDLNNLERGCVRIYEDNWNNCYIGWLDLDQRGWTKLAKKLRCGYVKSPKGHIRIPVPVRNLEGYKTGTLYYKGAKIGDAKLSGEVMLPGNAYYDKEGKFLGYYEYKAWGTFFPFQNQIWSNPQEFFTKLTEISGIEYKSIKEHLKLKMEQKVITENDYNTIPKTLFSAREPPWQKVGIHQIVSKNRY